MNRGFLWGLLLAFWPLSASAQIDVGEEAIDLSSARIVESFGYPGENGYYAIATGNNRASVVYACQEAARQAGILYQDYVEIAPISGGISTGIRFYCVGEWPVSIIPGRRGEPTRQRTCGCTVSLAATRRAIALMTTRKR